MFLTKMARNAKKKLAIFAGTSKCLIYAEAKYCASEMPGEIKYYECSRTEYCCGMGCCVSPGLHFHHLWYYWILVIIMFLVCSGGGWWYRYWLQGRYRAAASAIPPRASTSSRGPNSVRGPTCQGQRARISYNPGRNTVLLHRMWKGPQRNGTVPPLNGSAATSAHYQNMSVVLNDANCPYYQLYGPPPSYETVIAQTRGKISNPASPEATNVQTTMQSTSIAPSSIVAQCYSYSCNSSTRLNVGLEQNVQFPNGGGGGGGGGGTSSRQVEGEDGAVQFAHFPRYCTVPEGTIRRDMCIPFPYPEQSFVPRNSFNRIYHGSLTNDGPHHCGSYNYATHPDPSNAPDLENPNLQLANGVNREQVVPISMVHGGGLGSGDGERTEEGRESEREVVPEGAVDLGFFSICRGRNRDAVRKDDSKSDENSEENFDLELSKNRRVYGGSLRAAGRYAGKERCDDYSVERTFSKMLPRSCDGLINTEPAISAVDTSRNVSSLDDREKVSTSSFQSNPSNNVILECFVSDGASSSAGNVEKLEQGRSRHGNASTNVDVESIKYRLDRSKSLD